MSEQEKVFDFDGYNGMSEIERIQITKGMKFGGISISSVSLLDCERPSSRYSVLILEIRIEEPSVLIFHKYDSGWRNQGPSLGEICREMQLEFNPILNEFLKLGVKFGVGTCCLLAIALALRKARIITGSLQQSYPIEILEEFPEII